MKAVVVMRSGRQGQKRRGYTTRQRTADRRRAQKETRAEARAARNAARALERKGRRSTIAFRGCDPERTLALLGEDA